MSDEGNHLESVHLRPEQILGDVFFKIAVVILIDQLDRVIVINEVQDVSQDRLELNFSRNLSSELPRASRIG